MKQETILLVINEQRREKIIKINELNAYRGKVKTHTHIHPRTHMEESPMYKVCYQSKNKLKAIREELQQTVPVPIDPHTVLTKVSL